MIGMFSVHVILQQRIDHYDAELKFWNIVKRLNISFIFLHRLEIRIETLKAALNSNTTTIATYNWNQGPGRGHPSVLSAQLYRFHLHYETRFKNIISVRCFTNYVF